MEKEKVIPSFRKGDKVNDGLNLTPSALLKIYRGRGEEKEEKKGDSLTKESNVERHLHTPYKCQPMN